MRRERFRTRALPVRCGCCCARDRRAGAVRRLDVATGVVARRDHEGDDPRSRGTAGAGGRSGAARCRSRADDAGSRRVTVARGGARLPGGQRVACAYELPARPDDRCRGEGAGRGARLRRRARRRARRRDAAGFQRGGVASERRACWGAAALRALNDPAALAAVAVLAGAPYALRPRITDAIPDPRGVRVEMRAGPDWSSDPRSRSPPSGRRPCACSRTRRRRARSTSTCGCRTARPPAARQRKRSDGDEPRSRRLDEQLALDRLGSSTAAGGLWARGRPLARPDPRAARRRQARRAPPGRARQA